MFEPFGAETETFQDNLVNNMAADNLAPGIIRPLATFVLNIQGIYPTQMCCLSVENVWLILLHGPHFLYTHFLLTFFQILHDVMTWKRFQHYWSLWWGESTSQWWKFPSHRATKCGVFKRFVRYMSIHRNPMQGCLSTGVMPGLLFSPISIVSIAIDGYGHQGITAFSVV